MTDWQFGDILEHGDHTRIMFIGRREPIRRKPDGSVEFWGFTGMTLAVDCPGCSAYRHDPVGNVWESYGGDPDDNPRGRAWTHVGNAQ